MEMVQRMVRAARLDPSLYEEVEADQRATPQAMMVVIISSVAGGIGAGLSGALMGRSWFLVLLWGSVAALLGWYIWALLTYFIGTTIFKTPQTSATVGELLRTIGFASSPGIIRILAFLPGIGPLVVFVATIWMLVAMIIAVRQALDFSTARALGTCFVGWVVQVIFMVLVGALLGR
jgi:hypothetical protein